ncbi:hypothetical protein [Burkholderia aenigmatica]|uniref:hypothetical protein n=1 Tax=Burkholderia aenigmatica TaxID=2015348 RepID=UPI002650CEC8|nr:hypothetical protein [Burkholderia aenigmatica]MDN7880140.1 hypothetical protein [Burkholderia aenigmatica]
MMMITFLVNPYAYGISILVAVSIWFAATVQRNTKGMWIICGAGFAIAILNTISVMSGGVCTASIPPVCHGGVFFSQP